jgi:hypothetical protein
VLKLARNRRLRRKNNRDFTSVLDSCQAPLTEEQNHETHSVGEEHFQIRLTVASERPPRHLAAILDYRNEHTEH